MGQAKAMFNKLKGVEDRFIKLEQLLSDPAVVSDRVLYQKYIKEHGEISKLMEAYRRYKKIIADLEEAQELLTDDDPDMKEMAQEEIGPLEEQKVALEEELKILLIPKDPLDEKSVIVELRAGTGGDESALFAGDLFKMYTRYAESLGWGVEVMDSHASDVGGFKEVVFQVSGKGAYSSFKYESGVHRVQRVPATETQGRIHTSAVTVAVLPEAEDVELKIEPNELRIDIFRSSGPGGQSVNTTDSAVRITHIPSGITATCQDEKSQHKNREKAMKVLRSRVLDKMVQETEAKRSAERKGQIEAGIAVSVSGPTTFPRGG